MSSDHNPPRKYSCRVSGCGKSFTRRDYLDRHAVNHRSEKPFVCPKCAKAYARADVLKRHVADHPRRKGSPAPLRPLSHVTEQSDTSNDGPSRSSTAFSSHPDAMETVDSLEALFTWYTNPEFEFETFGADSGASMDSLSGQLDGFVNHHASGERTKLLDSQTWQACTDFVARSCLQSPVQGWSEPDVDRYIELYFLHFHAQYPIIHRPSLNIRGIRPHLLIAVACLGSVSSTTPVDREFLGKLQLALKLHLFSILAESSSPDADVLQAFFLINHYGNNYCSRELARTGQMFHSAGVTAAKNAGVFNTLERTPSHQLSIHEQWLEWAGEQERIRLAWMIFTDDCFGSGVLRHSVMLQCFSLTVPLPCEESIWTAACSSDWQATMLQRNHDRFQFRPGIRQLMATGRLPDNDDPLGMWILLHGLLTLTWALSNQGPDMFTLARRAQITTWKSSLSFALEQWQVACRDKFPFLGTHHPHYVSGMAISHMSSISLLTDLDSVRILAGAQYLNGRHIGSEDRVASRLLLEAWAQSAEGRQSCWIAINCLMTTFASFGLDDSVKPCPRTLWCIYISTITMWIYTALIEERSIDPRTYTLVHPDQHCRIEANLARKSAQQYLDRIYECQDPINLPEVSDLDSCTALVAYAAHLCGHQGWGGLAGPTRVLYGLLKHAELAMQQGYANC